MILSVNNISFNYKNKSDAFSNVSFDAHKGDIVAVLGANGAGKTTILRCLLKFLKIKSGSITLNGSDVYTISNKDFWSKVSYVPQAKGVENSYTVLESVLLGLSSKIGPFSSPDCAQINAAKETVNSLGIGHITDAQCNKISGGERQLVLIARAMVSKPELLVLDEPESNLDFRNQMIVLNAIKSFAEKGTTCIFNTHYPEHALQTANKSLILSKGGSVFGPSAEIITRENIVAAFGVDTVITEYQSDSGVVKNIVPLGIKEQ